MLRSLNRSGMKSPRIGPAAALLAASALLAATALLTTESCKKNASTGKKKPPAQKSIKTRPGPAPARASEPAPARPPERDGPGAAIAVKPWSPEDPKDNRAVYSLRMGGQTVGTLVAEERYKPGAITSSATAHMTLKRMDQNLRFHTVESYTERPDGTPVSFHVELDQMVSKVTMSGVHRNGYLEVQGPTGRQKIQWNKEWLFPRAISRLARQKGYAPGTTFTYLKFQPQMGMKGITVTHQVLGDSRVTVMGKTFACHRIKVTASVLPPQEACVDDEGVAYTMKFNMGVIRMDMELVRRDKK